MVYENGREKKIGKDVNIKREVKNKYASATNIVSIFLVASNDRYEAQRAVLKRRENETKEEEMGKRFI